MRCWTLLSTLTPCVPGLPAICPASFPPTYSLVNTERPNSRLKLAGVRRNRDWFLLRHLISKMFSSFYQLPIPPTDCSPAHLPSPCEGIWDQGTLWISWVKVFWLRSPVQELSLEICELPPKFSFLKKCVCLGPASLFLEICPNKVIWDTRIVGFFILVKKLELI